MATSVDREHHEQRPAFHRRAARMIEGRAADALT
jgi:hypothetical protein